MKPFCTPLSAAALLAAWLAVAPRVEAQLFRNLQDLTERLPSGDPALRATN